MTLVSIVTPSYNQGAYLEDTMRSVLLQDYPEIEYLVVDGGSTDNSRDIISSYAERLAWWISEPDKGQADAINKGFRRARGDIVAWLNSDDLLLPGAVRLAVSQFSAAPESGFVFGNALTIDLEGHPLNTLSFGDWALADLMMFRIICQPAVFMRRKILEQAGLLDETYHFMLDHHLWLRMALLAPIRHLPEALAAARYHSEAKNVKQAAGFGDETQRLLDWMYSQPNLTSLIRQNTRQIKAGAYRLSARYYLDGDETGTALRYYWMALVNSPGYTLKHWHRMAYAASRLVGADRLADRWFRQAFARQKYQSTHKLTQELAGWPGIKLDNSASP